ncbi:hypothetical protein GH714_040095 [Hevea brasiliensis]|uniref:Uncharacterized protein n=1 Tax=Hevea brasiliensis TaxID=3981 RepID=A0A6A6MTG2_HEVBR|nr:hypothetical protein GH714_040095 [Hevea brasiliensis]
MGSLKQVDDATFRKKLEEITKAAEDELKSLHLLADAILEDFHVKKANNAGLEETIAKATAGSEHSKEEKEEEEEEGYCDFKKQRKSNKKMKRVVENYASTIIRKRSREGWGIEEAKERGNRFYQIGF